VLTADLPDRLMLGMAAVFNVRGFARYRVNLFRRCLPR
jgi:hypothetical protein